jgi:hypothetical protein
MYPPASESNPKRTAKVRADIGGVIYTRMHRCLQENVNAGIFYLLGFFGLGLPKNTF